MSPTSQMNLLFILFPCPLASMRLNRQRKKDWVSTKPWRDGSEVEPGGRLLFEACLLKMIGWLMLLLGILILLVCLIALEASSGFRSTDTRLPVVTHWYSDFIALSMLSTHSLQLKSS